MDKSVLSQNCVQCYHLRTESCVFSLFVGVRVRPSVSKSFKRFAWIFVKFWEMHVFDKKQSITFCDDLDSRVARNFHFGGCSLGSWETEVRSRAEANWSSLHTLFTNVDCRNYHNLKLIVPLILDQSISRRWSKRHLAGLYSQAHDWDRYRIWIRILIEDQFITSERKLLSLTDDVGDEPLSLLLKSTSEWT